MGYINENIPFFYALARREFFYDLSSHHNEFEEVCVFGVAGIQSRALGFHVMMKCGAQWARLPLHALCWKEDAPLWPLDQVELWDSFGYHLSVTRYDFLRDLAVDVFLKDHKFYRGQYLFTLDWAESNYSEIPDQHKQHHIIKLDNGNFAAMPNNRCRWWEPSFVVPFTEKPDFIANSRVFYCEGAEVL